ncbi:MAG: metal-sensitive transcriptional regulator [Calditerrivibrio sp.]|nr:metal-sensitive transcriptional regulator [Calditerrivibrio sp.]MCA1931947.1 metal-sensitive transcriptional regulator [Calditerrivibrio sp.]MCA1980966.1 metal-sensitive transcriptional regulator [Calditerrivibrio sp.]
MKHEAMIPRLKKVEGQIRGLIKMIEEEKYCIDILQQISASIGALKSISVEIMKNHINSCVKNAILNGSDEEKIEELTKTIYKFIK